MNIFKDAKTFIALLSQVAEERGLPRDKVLEVVETALAAAYKKDFGKKGEIVKAKLNLETGEVKFWQEKVVVDKSMVYEDEEEKEEGKIKYNPKKHIYLEEAKKIDPNIKPGEVLVFPLETKEDYGRIAAQTAKQVILQKLKEVERELLYEEFKQKEGEVVSGMIQRIEGNNIWVDLGKALGVLPLKEQIPGENYRPQTRMRFYVKKVEQTPKGPMIILSRSYPKFLTKLFEIEVPEIASGQVEIKAIAREPGSRSKVAVISKQEGIDPIGAMVGQRGTRVSAVMDTLGGEKIDIVLWSEKPEEFIANALSPAKVSEVRIENGKKALAIVPDDQLSLAIGKDGQNVRLAAKLTGWKIDVKSQSEMEEEMEKEKTKETRSISQKSDNSENEVKHNN